MTQTEHVEVTQADREAYLAFNSLPPWDTASVRAGEWDNTTGMQVLARHRQSSIAPLVEENAELKRWLRCIADDCADQIDAWDVDGCDPAVAIAFVQGTEDIARVALSPPPKENTDV